MIARLLLRASWCRLLPLSWRIALLRRSAATITTRRPRLSARRRRAF